jgi:hypothetical protein
MLIIRDIDRREDPETSARVKENGHPELLK